MNLNSKRSRSQNKETTKLMFPGGPNNEFHVMKHFQDQETRNLHLQNTDHAI